MEVNCTCNKHKSDEGKNVAVCAIHYFNFKSFFLKKWIENIPSVNTIFVDDKLLFLNKRYIKNNSFHYFIYLPRELQHIICTFVNGKDICNIYNSSNYTRTLFTTKECRYIQKTIYIFNLQTIMCKNNNSTLLMKNLLFILYNAAQYYDIYNSVIFDILKNPPNIRYCYDKCYAMGMFSFMNFPQQIDTKVFSPFIFEDSNNKKQITVKFCYKSNKRNVRGRTKYIMENFSFLDISNKMKIYSKKRIIIEWD